jgi:hypothetical protein
MGVKGEKKKVRKIARSSAECYNVPRAAET